MNAWSVADTYHVVVMDVVQAYAIAAGSIFTALTLWNIRSHFSSAATRYLLYPRLLPRNRFLPSQSPAETLFQTFLLAANIFAIVFRCADVQDAALRAGRLAVVNMVPLFAGLHLDTLADLLGVSLAKYRTLHRLTGWMAFVLLGFHALVPVVIRLPFSVRTTENRWALTVGGPYPDADWRVDTCRAALPSVSSYSPLCPYCAGCGTSCSFAPIRQWLCFLLIPPGDIWQRHLSL